MSMKTHSKGEGGIPVAQEMKNQTQRIVMNTCCFHLYSGMNILAKK